MRRTDATLTGLPPFDTLLRMRWNARLPALALLAALFALWSLPLVFCAEACEDEHGDEGDSCPCVCHASLALPPAVVSFAEPSALRPPSPPVEPSVLLRDERAPRPPTA